MLIALIVFIVGSMIAGSIIEGLDGGGSNSSCPYCDSGDTDGNHCYTCEDDF